MRKSKIFLILSLAFLSGIFWRSFLPGRIFVFILLIMAVIAAAAFYKNKHILVVSLSVFLFVFGFWNAHSSIEKAKNAGMDGQEISGKGMVAKEPEKKDDYQSVVIKTDKGLILANVGLYNDLKYGDELEINCTLKIPENKNSDFDYRMYLAKDKIFYLCQNSSLEKTGENKGNKIYRSILSLKNRLSKNINSVLPEPESSLANGLIFGGSSQLPKDVSDDFSKTGLSHVVAVSGFNVTIIAEYLMVLGVFIGFWRKQAFWFAVIGIFLFVLSVGFPSSAVRAGVMGSLLIWAMKNGRLANSFNAIIFSAGIMLLLNPLLLRWDVGFQLSFLAALGIIELSPFWENYVIEKAKVFGMLENVFLTLSATLFVLPVIIYNFHTVSIISLLANALVLPFIPLAMLLVFMASLAGIIGTTISLPFSWIAFLLLKYITETVRFLAGFSWSSVSVENFGIKWLVIWYVALFLLLFFIRRNLRPKLKINFPEQNV